MQTKQKPPLGEIRLLHQVEGETEGTVVRDTDECMYCRKQVKDWKATEECPERRRKKATQQG